jgi:hypothetical protein
MLCHVLQRRILDGETTTETVGGCVQLSNGSCFVNPGEMRVRVRATPLLPVLWCGPLFVKNDVEEVRTIYRAIDCTYI